VANLKLLEVGLLVLTEPIISNHIVDSQRTRSCACKILRLLSDFLKDPGLLMAFCLLFNLLSDLLQTIHKTKLCPLLQFVKQLKC